MTDTTATVKEKAITSGTHRVWEPEKSLKKAMSCADAMGITRVANVTGMDRIGIAVATACRPTSKSNVMAQGKGLSLAAAKVSALMECIECFHAENIELEVISGSVKDFRSQHRMADVFRLARADTRSVDLREDIDWIHSKDLYTGETTMVPFEMVDLDCTKPPSCFSGYFVSDTNGLASGNTVDEAICHALCEVVERDAISIWNSTGILERGSTGVSLSSIEDEPIQKLIERIEAAELRLSVWDITADTKMPVYRALISSGDHDTTDPEFGTGCHLDAKVALCRAITEAAQARATYITGARDDMPPSLYQSPSRSERRKFCNLLHKTNKRKRQFGDGLNLSTASFESDISSMLSMLSDVGISEVLMVDLTKPEFDIPVVKVIIPGLEGMDDNAAYTPGERAQ